MTARVKRIDRKEVIDLLQPYIVENFGGEGWRHFTDCLRLTTTMWVGYGNGELVCIWGVITPTLLSDQAYLWLYHTDKIKDHVFIFVRKSQIAIEKILKLHPTIIGHTHARNANAIRWLKWLGAEYGEPEGEFIPFTIRAKK